MSHVVSRLTAGPWTKPLRRLQLPHWLEIEMTYAYSFQIERKRNPFLNVSIFNNFFLLITCTHAHFLLSIAINLQRINTFLVFFVMLYLPIRWNYLHVALRKCMICGIGEYKHTGSTLIELKNSKGVKKWRLCFRILQ